MSDTVRYRAESEAEIENANVWFEDQLQGLGDRFIVKLELLDARLAENPLLYQVLEPPDSRRRLTHRFPYALLYRVLDNEVAVLACFHHHQRPRTRDELLARD